ncbi:MAG: metal-dependent phosphohydrolase, partial [Trichodesmium sp. St17_bin3_1_1]|nr:metal-dependent phosphohydrolase [Trichodesmium sp. St17_bin3_1_1]
MFNSTELLIGAFIKRLTNGYRHTYGGYKSDYADIIA